MFLRSLSIRGFKSFADKTTLEFAPGVSVIVGPNGSGKSNLVDAIAWVLGEQGPRALRGGQMADVIFAGSPGRRPIGLAEVTLVIDNEAGLIPVPDSEIEVGRVVARSGESDYLVGGKPARLMDIQELLSDTGIGRALHTVVGQGQLEDVLIARPEDRRQFIEEAAGIAKHRRRKERAQRKLASLDQDLLRLQDVMTELKRRLRPLKQQAEAAGKHEKLSSEAASLAVRLAASRLRELQRVRDGKTPVWEEGRARRQEAEARLAELDARIAGLAEELAAAERALTEAEAAETDAVRERSAAEQALREAVRAEGDARERLAAEAGRSGRLFSLEEDTARLEAQIEETTTALADQEAALAAAEREHAEAEARRRDAEDARRHARELAVTRRAEVQSVRRSLEISRVEQERLSASLADVARREGEARAERDGLEREIEGLDSQSTPKGDRIAEVHRTIDRLAAEVRELEDQERRLEGRRQALDERRRALRETPGRRFLRSKRGRAVGLVSELIEVDEGMERAVAAALGPLGDAVVYEDHGVAVGDAGDARGTTIAVSEEMPGAFVLPGARSLLSVVRVDPRARAAVANALRHVYIAADRKEALARHRKYPAASFVTRDGLLVGPALVRTASEPGEDELAVRREEMSIDGDLGRTRKQRADRQKELDTATGERDRLESELKHADGLITVAAERMGRVDAELAALRREREVLEQRLSGVEQHVTQSAASLDDDADVEEELPELPPVAEPPVALRVEVESLRRELRRLEQALSGRREETRRLKETDPERLAAEVERAIVARTGAEAALTAAEERATGSAGARESAAAAVAAIRTADAEANRAWREAAEALGRLRDEYEDQEQARRDIERRIEEAEGVLRTGHAADPAEALASLTDEDTLETLQKRSDLVARRLALLGRVNLVAADEYRELQERHDFLEREIEDVRSAKRDLQQVVREVDRKVVEIFDAAFHDVAGEFEAMFAQLFPGGEGKLTLTEPDDLLSSGIDIEARPGRKRVKRLSLLSGGERALTALGFLFSIFRARPSPFYLLDEVEAALDDINLHRFLELIRGFAGTSQVILVTHQKRTMEAADVLYGVSMGRDGASRVIAQRVADAVPS